MVISHDRSSVRSAGRLARSEVQGLTRAGAERSLLTHLRSLHSVSRSAGPNGSVGVFIAHDGEPDLMPFIEWLWDQDKTVALPVLNDDPTDFSMRFVPWSRDDELHAGRYGIPVPPAAPAIDPDTLLVSFTGFDSKGNRIGRGAGFFDRYLASFDGEVIGVGFEVQRFDAVPVESHDQQLPTIVTDLGVRYVHWPQ